MRKHICLCLWLLIAAASIARAEVIILDGITYSLDKEKQEACLTEGANRDTVVIPDFIVDGDAKYPVTTIGKEAFRNSSTLTAITIGKKVYTIGTSAFQGCKQLISVTIPGNVSEIGKTAFYNCTGLEEMRLGEGLAKISHSAFGNCTSLKVINIPSTLQESDSGAFSGCYSLEKVEIADLQAFCNIHFEDGGNPLHYAKRIFMDGQELTEIDIPEGVTTISAGLFKGCEHITHVSIPTTLEEIPASTFSYCRKLERVAIPETAALKNVQADAFSFCDSLRMIQLPEAVSTIGEKAFWGCTSLESINIPPFVTALGKNCFFLCPISRIVFSSVNQACGLLFEYSSSCMSETPWHLYIQGEEVTHLTIPEGFTSLGRRQFENCVSLRSVKIPSTLESIGERAFMGCTSLQRTEFASIESMCGLAAYSNPLEYTHDLYINGELVTDLVIPAGVKRIAPCAFKGSNIRTVTIGDDVAEIEWDAFQGCEMLESVRMGKGMKRVKNAFECCPNFNKVDFPSLECLLGMQFNYSSASGMSVSDKVRDNTNPLYYARHLYIGGKEVHHLVIPEGTKKIGDFSFINCESLVSVIVPEGVTDLGMQVFAGCTNLESIELPSTLNDYHVYDFYDCPSLERIKVQKGNPYMYSTARDDALIVTRHNELVVGGVNAVIPDSVPYIGRTAFYGRTKLASIFIPSAVKEIRGRAFARCDSLTDVFLDVREMPKTNSLAFDNSPIGNATLHVPENMIETFRETAPWSGFGNIVALLPEDIPNGIGHVSSSGHLSSVGAEADAIYDLQGRKLNARPQRGLYIQGGKMRMAW